MSLVVNCDEDSTWALMHQPELLTGQSHGGRVDDGHHLRHILAYQPIEQMLVAVLG